MLKKNILVVLCILIFMSLACRTNLPVIEIQPEDTQTMNISIDPSNTNAATTHISVAMGAGKLNIQSGTQKLIEGTITYNVPQWEPVVEQSSESVQLKQAVEEFNLTKLPVGEYQNEWDLKLGSYPITFELQAGAYDGTLDFSDIPITNLSISDGASSAEVLFSTPNPTQMEHFSYKTGASNVSLQGLSNANFDYMTFVGGAGNFTLDFSGTPQHEANVDIESGVSSLEIRIPEGINSEIIISGDLIDTSVKGSWVVENNTYRTENEGPLLTIHVQTNIGSLTLVHD